MVSHWNYLRQGRACKISKKERPKDTTSSLPGSHVEKNMVEQSHSSLYLIYKEYLNHTFGLTLSTLGLDEFRLTSKLFHKHCMAVLLLEV